MNGLSLFTDSETKFKEFIVKSVVLDGVRGLRHRWCFHQ